MPTAEEVEPWVEAIVRLWDDRPFYREQSEKARRQAERWHPVRLRPLYAEFFGGVRPHAGPPIAARTPYVSVITPVHNGAKTLERAVRSVMAQTFGNWEMFLVDDCSTDDSRKIASALAAEDSRVRLIEKSENTGPAQPGTWHCVALAGNSLPTWIETMSTIRGILSVLRI